MATGKQKPIDCACFNLRKASRLMAQTFDRYLQPSGLNNTQFSLLTAAAGRGSTSITELARWLGMDRTTLSRNLRLVEREGLLRLGPGPDGRTREVKVTARGRRKLEVALPLWRKAQGAVVEALGERRWSKLLKDLRRAAEVAEALA